MGFILVPNRGPNGLMYAPAAALYKPPMPAPGIPGVDFPVGRVSTNPVNVASLGHLPAGWTWAGPGNLVRVNGSASDWDFTGIDGYFGVQTPNVVIDNCLFGLGAVTWSNQPFWRIQTVGHYSITNCTFDGMNSTGFVNSCISGQCILAERNWIKNWPLDLIDLTPLQLRTNSGAYGLGRGMSVTSRGNLDFFCTTAGTTAASEPAAYATAVDGQVIVDGSAVFTASAVTHKVRYNVIQSSSSMIGGLHTDGMQIVNWASGAGLEVYNNDIDIRNPMNSTVTAPINIGGTINSDVRVFENILRVNTGNFCMYGSLLGSITTADYHYYNNYIQQDNAGPVYSNQPLSPDIKIDGFYDYSTGQHLPFAYNNGVSLQTVFQRP